MFPHFVFSQLSVLYDKLQLIRELRQLRTNYRRISRFFLHLPIMILHTLRILRPHRLYRLIQILPRVDFILESELLRIFLIRERSRSIRPIKPSTVHDYLRLRNRIHLSVLPRLWYFLGRLLWLTGSWLAIHADRDFLLDLGDFERVLILFIA